MFGIFGTLGKGVSVSSERLASTGVFSKLGNGCTCCEFVGIIGISGKPCDIFSADSSVFTNLGAGNSSLKSFCVFTSSFAIVDEETAVASCDKSPVKRIAFFSSTTSDSLTVPAVLSMADIGSAVSSGNTSSEPDFIDGICSISKISSSSAMIIGISSASFSSSAVFISDGSSACSLPALASKASSIGFIGSFVSAVAFSSAETGAISAMGDDVSTASSGVISSDSHVSDGICSISKISSSSAMVIGVSSDSFSSSAVFISDGSSACSLPALASKASSIGFIGSFASANSFSSAETGAISAMGDDVSFCSPDTF